VLTSNVKCGAAARRGRAAMACSASGAGAGVATADRRAGDGAATARRGDGAAQQAGDGAAGGAASSDGTDGRRAEGRALRSCRSVEGKQASATATVRVLVEADLRGCDPAWKEARMGESMGHSASLADGSYAAMGLDTIDLGPSVFGGPVQLLTLHMAFDGPA